MSVALFSNDEMSLREDIDKPTTPKAIQNYRYFDEHPIILGGQKCPIKKISNAACTTRLCKREDQS